MFLHQIKTLRKTIASLQQNDWKKSIQISLLKKDNKNLKSRLEQCDQNKSPARREKFIPKIERELMLDTEISESPTCEEEYIHLASE